MPLADEPLVGLLLARGPDLISRGLATQICAMSGGNPLFALEIVDSLLRSGVRPRAGQPLPVPAKLDGLVRQRLTGLPQRARETLRVAAAAARPTVTLLISAGCQAPGEDLATAATGAE